MSQKCTVKELISEVSKAYIGNEDVVKDLVLAFSAGLHILIEDISGIGKTTLVKSLGKATGLNLGRIQFTPDLLPGDITGMSIWDPQKKEFILKKGSIFNEFILGDEINRASPKTQSALLEAMEESTVSIDGTSYQLPNPFTVIATKNPGFYLGTFDMPESQLDRFGILIKPGYPTANNEKLILQEFKNKKAIENITSIVKKEDILQTRQTITSIDISDKVLEYIVEIGNKTRKHSDIKFGLSTRGLQHLIKLAQSNAYYSNRDFLIPEDIIYSSSRVIPHKIQLKSEAIINNISPKQIVDNIVKKTKIPVGLK